MKKNLGIISVLSVVIIALIVLLVLHLCGEYNNLSFMFGMIVGAFAVILPFIINRYYN